MAFSALGYESAHHGEGRWNGVAILSRVGLDDVVAGFADGAPDDPEARLLRATCGGVRVASVYVPNGRALDHDHYQYKLRWLERLRGHLDASRDPSDAGRGLRRLQHRPGRRDVWDIAELVGATHVSAPERAALPALLDWGLDRRLPRAYPDTDRLFSWWDYRAGNFHKGTGMRIDLVLGIAAAGRARAVGADRPQRAQGQAALGPRPRSSSSWRTPDGRPRRHRRAARPATPGSAGLGRQHPEAARHAAVGAPRRAVPGGRRHPRRPPPDGADQRAGRRDRGGR